MNTRPGNIMQKTINVDILLFSTQALGNGLLN